MIKRYFWVFPVLLMIIIFCFSSQPASESTQMSSPFAEFLERLLYGDDISSAEHDRAYNFCQFLVRKGAHFSVYAFLGLLVTLSVRFSDKWRYRLAAPVICFIYSVTDEIHQHFVKGRSCELRDVLIDTSGAVLGFLIVFIIIYFKEKRSFNGN